MTGKKNVISNKQKEVVSEPTTEPVASIVEGVPEQAAVPEQAGGAPKAKAKAKAKAEVASKEKVVPKRKPKVTSEEQVNDKIIKKKEMKERKTKKEKKDKVGGENQEVNSEEELVNGRKLRSFKVKLPNSETFEGRFTGLTPYQAANKALSKYFRVNKESSAEVVFSINETTRSSKKTVYNYVGKRFKLESPVTYEIKDAKDGAIRQIIKNYKNVLKKVKKVDTVKES